MVFVFGSNLLGIHGKGAALVAASRGYPRWKVEGRFGDLYAIPTKATPYRPLSFSKVSDAVHLFLKHAWEHPYEDFQVTRVGCGLAGFKDEQIAPLFGAAPTNCYFDSAWAVLLSNAKLWGSFPQ